MYRFFWGRSHFELGVVRILFWVRRGTYILLGRIPLPLRHVPYLLARVLLPLRHVPYLLGRGPFIPIRRRGSLLLMRRRGCSDPGSGNSDSGGSGGYLFQAGVVVLGDPL